MGVSVSASIERPLFLFSSSVESWDVCARLELFILVGEKDFWVQRAQLHKSSTGLSSLGFSVCRMKFGAERKLSHTPPHLFLLPSNSLALFRVSVCFSASSSSATFLDFAFSCARTQHHHHEKEMKRDSSWWNQWEIIYRQMIFCCLLHVVSFQPKRKKNCVSARSKVSSLRSIVELLLAAFRYMFSPWIDMEYFESINSRVLWASLERS